MPITARSMLADTKRVLTLKFFLIATPLAVISILLWRFLFPAVPKPVETFDVLWTQQGWNPDQREKYYQTTQGTLFIPYSWYFALEQQPALNIWKMHLFDSKKLFSEMANLSSYRLIPDPRPKYNPDRLPIGITKTTIQDQYVDQLGLGQKEWLSYTCAACHTAQLNYHGLGIRIDGAPGMWNFTQFNTTVANLLQITYWLPSKFDRFAGRVLQRQGRPDNAQTREHLHTAVRRFLQSAPIAQGVRALKYGTYPTAEGFGRMDALGRGANGQFVQLSQSNVLTADAPVGIPPLWYTHDFDWVQSVGAIRQPMGRNVTESWGVNSIVDLSNPDPNKRFATTVTMREIFWMETLVSVLDPPRWPEEIFGPIDKAAAERGRQLYHERVFTNALEPAQEQWCPTEKDVYPSGWKLQPCPNPLQVTADGRKGLCARCHGPFKETNPNEAGMRYWQLPIYKLDFIGTDPNDAQNFAARQVYTGILKNDYGADRVGIAQALGFAVEKAMEKKYVELHVPPDSQPTWNGFRENAFRGPLGYPARPLDGYWATGPFLHNNSIPNLYQLLSPVAERSQSYWVGDMEFDPVHVGYVTNKFEGGFEFRTSRTFLAAIWNTLVGLFRGQRNFQRSIDGNSIEGHEFRDAPNGAKGVIGPSLTARERMDIIEYMKTMQTVPPPTPAEVERRRKLLSAEASEYESKPQYTGKALSVN